MKSLRLSRNRMDEAQRGGVEGLAGGTARFRQRWVADFGEMNANLVSAAGFEAAFEDGVVAELFEGADVGDGPAGP